VSGSAGDPKGVFYWSRHPPRPDAGEKGERAAVVEREPYRRTGAIRQNLVLSEAGKGYDAATLDAEPSPPVAI
jgi:hypothetical protein